MPLDAVRELARQAPNTAADAAPTLLRHSDLQGWGLRDFNYANTPLRWAHEVLRVLTEDGHFGLAEDVATVAFASEAAWDRWAQKRIHGRLAEESGGARRRDYAASHPTFRRTRLYASPLQTGRILSRTLAAEFGR